MREQPSGCSRLFFPSTVFDYILCRISENVVESGRIFLASLAENISFYLLLTHLVQNCRKNSFWGKDYITGNRT